MSYRVRPKPATSSRAWCSSGGKARLRGAATRDPERLRQENEASLLAWECRPAGDKSKKPTKKAARDAARPAHR